MECSARFLPRCSLSLESLQMSARMDVNSLEGTIPNYGSTPSGLFASHFKGLSIYGRHLSKYFRGPYLPSSNATPLSHITIPLSIWIANAKSSPPPALSLSLLCTCRPVRKKWMHSIDDAVAITSRNYGQSSPTNRRSPRMGSTLPTYIPRGDHSQHTESHLLSSGVVLGYQIL